MLIKHRSRQPALATLLLLMVLASVSHTETINLSSFPSFSNNLAATFQSNLKTANQQTKQTNSLFNIQGLFDSISIDPSKNGGNIVQGSGNQMQGVSNRLSGSNNSLIGVNTTIVGDLNKAFGLQNTIFGNAN